MIFSTLLPTTAHGPITLLGLQGISPCPVRRYVANLVKASPTHTLEPALAPLAVGAVWSVPFSVVRWALYFGWPHIGNLISSIGWFYLDTLKALAQFYGPDPAAARPAHRPVARHPVIR